MIPESPSADAVDAKEHIDQLGVGRPGADGGPVGTVKAEGQTEPVPRA